ncbi:MAG: energy transducer TonB [Acidobacteria bacterium]|nr:energy transducer TonB [Acidobacteriota bacterium]
MRTVLVFFFFLFCLILSSPSLKAQTESTSLAILYQDSQSETLSSNLTKTLSQNGFNLQDINLTKTITKNLKFPNEMNLSTKEARNLGQALGVDTFLVLKSKIVERADVGATLYGEGFLALAFVNSKSGKLILFDFIEIKQPTLDLAKEEIAKELINKIPSYKKNVLTALEAEFDIPKVDPQDAEAIEIPIEGSKLAEKFDLPEFTSRKPPLYTEMARKMGVSAIVELEIVLRKDGNIGNIEVIHWAGFGLEESAIMAAKELKFEPALLEDTPISCRALIRYNFNLKNQR